MRWSVLALLAVNLVGCAKYNTYFNAKRAFDNAEHVRQEAIRKHQEPSTPTGAQKADYETAIRKAQKILDEYPGHSLTDDALFLQAKARHRLESYRMSIRDLDLLFTNFPATDYLEEALYLQASNYLLLGAVERSQEYLNRLAKLFPDSEFQAETARVTGDNAYALEEWEAAVTAYRNYLALDVPSAEKSAIGLKLGNSFWELERYAAADSVLSELVEATDVPELSFRGRLLQARVKVRQGEHDQAAALLDPLRDEAEPYNAQGEVALVEAENLIAQGRGDDASPLLENMPQEWQTPAVKARAADLLGYLFLERGEWEEARERFRTAILKSDELDDPVRSRRLADNLKEYLAAEQSLPDARPDQVPRLKLLQANALLFGFDRPAMAARLYGEAAADTAADSALAARALYGAYVVYDRHLARPDSAALFAARLEQNHPQSPQAFEVRKGEGADLLGYLLARRETTQRSNLAALSREEREALVAPVVATEPTSSTPTVRYGNLRRRQIYLSRRDNLVFPPPEGARSGTGRGAVAGRAGPQKPVSGEGVPVGGARVPGRAVADDVPAGGLDRALVNTGTDSLRLAQPPSPAAPADSTRIPPEAVPANAQDKDQAADKQKERELEDNWDFLRSPAPDVAP